MLWMKQNERCSLADSCLRFWTTSTWCVPRQSSHAGKTRVWNKAGSVLPTWAIWGPRSGTRMVQDLGHPRRFSCVRAGCFPFHVCQTFNAVGKSSWCPLSPLVEGTPSFTIRSVRPRHAMVAVLGGVPGSSEQKVTAHEIMSLPIPLGGLGLCSGERMRPAACWASWVDALPMLSPL